MQLATGLIVGDLFLQPQQKLIYEIWSYLSDSDYNV